MIFKIQTDSAGWNYIDGIEEVELVGKYVRISDGKYKKIILKMAQNKPEIVFDENCKKKIMEISSGTLSGEFVDSKLACYKMDNNPICSYIIIKLYNGAHRTFMFNGRAYLLDNGKTVEIFK